MTTPTETKLQYQQPGAALAEIQAAIEILDRNAATLGGQVKTSLGLAASHARAAMEMIDGDRDPLTGMRTTPGRWVDDFVPQYAGGVHFVVNERTAERFDVDGDGKPFTATSARAFSEARNRELAINEAAGRG